MDREIQLKFTRPKLGPTSGYPVWPFSACIAGALPLVYAGYDY